jgi:hypothetical protein
VGGARDVGAGVGEQLDEVAVADEVDADRRGGGDRPLERRAGALAAVGDRAGVQEERAPGLPRLIASTGNQ